MANGYMDMIPVPSMSGNPESQWVQMAQANQNASTTFAQNKLPGMAQSMNQQMQAMGEYGADTAPIPYPAHANDWGLGQQNTPSSGDSARGNPWLLKGDALSR